MSSDNTFKTVNYNWSSDDLTMDVGFSAQELDDVLNSNIISTTGAQGSSYTISTSAGANGTSWSYYNSPIINVNGADKSLKVTGDAEFDGDLKVGGVSIKDSLESINKRLAILQPDPEKLEHFEALRKAYEHYKTLEALCQLPSKKEET
jgi:hypothetical protein